MVRASAAMVRAWAAMVRAWAAMVRARTAMTTMCSVAQPDQIATAISWLACDEASDVNGALLSVDAGRDAA